MSESLQAAGPPQPARMHEGRVETGLFVPCYVDQLVPSVGLATLEVLERVGCRVLYDPTQTCCGQPFLNLGCEREARQLARAHVARFSRYDAVVCPSASCVATVRHHFAELGLAERGPGRRILRRTFELSEFLVNELGRTDLGARFPHRVVLMPSCHGLRELGLGVPSETRPRPAVTLGPPERLLRAVADLDLVFPERPDECCGFGGAFSVSFPEVSRRIGTARLESLAATDAEYVTSTDVSCLLHLDGIRRRLGWGPRPIHLAEILAPGRTP